MNEIDNILFVEVVPTESQVSDLYELLKIRHHNISHEGMPSMDEHRRFVLVHPYRKWYLVKNESKTLGAFYISNENTLGINLNGKPDTRIVFKIIEYVKDKFKPLPEIKSVRNACFAVNANPENSGLINALETAGAKKIQLTYKI